MGQRVGEGFLDDGSIGDGIGEGETDFDGVGAGSFERGEEVGGGGEIGIGGGDEGHEGDLVFLFEGGKDLREALRLIGHRGRMIP